MSFRKRVLSAIPAPVLTGPAKLMARAIDGIWWDASAGIHTFLGTDQVTSYQESDYGSESRRSPGRMQGKQPARYLDWNGVVGDGMVPRKHQAGATGGTAWSSGKVVSVADAFAKVPIPGLGGHSGTSGFYFCFAFSTGITTGYYLSMVGDRVDAAPNAGWELYFDADQATPLRLRAGTGSGVVTVPLTPPVEWGWSQFGFFPTNRRMILEGWYDGTNLKLAIDGGTPGSAALTTLGASAATDLTMALSNTVAGTSGYFGCHLAGFLYVEGTSPTDTERAQVRAWANDVMGTSIGPAAPQDVFPAGFADANAYGTPTIGAGINATGLLDGAAALGSPVIYAQLVPSAFADANAYGTPAIGGQVVPAGIAGAEAFGSPTASATVAPAAIAGAEAFGVPVVQTTPDGIVATGFADPDGYGSPTLSAAVAPAGFVDGPAVGAPSIGAQLSPIAIATAEAFGSPVAYAQIVPAGFDDGSAFGVPNTVPPILMVGFADANAYGTPTLAAGLQLAGVPTAQAFGVPLVGDPPKPPTQVYGGGGGRGDRDIAHLIAGQEEEAQRIHRQNQLIIEAIVLAITNEVI